MIEKGSVAPERWTDTHGGFNFPSVLDRRSDRTHIGTPNTVSHTAGRNGIVTRTVVPRSGSLFNSNVPFN